MKKGFTLIELIVAVSILSVGIVLILRSFLSSSGAIGLIADRMEALQILESRMADLKMKAMTGAMDPANTSEQIDLNNRAATYNTAISILKSGDTEDESSDFREARISLGWQEDNKGQDESLATYFENKKNSFGQTNPL